MVEFGFMFPRGETFYVFSETEISQVLESLYDFDGPAPLAVYKPDIALEDWISEAKQSLLRVSDTLAEELKNYSDPDDDEFVSVPFPETLRVKIANQVNFEVGYALLKSSRSVRDYFRLWLPFTRALNLERQTVRIGSNNVLVFWTAVVVTAIAGIWEVSVAQYHPSPWSGLFTFLTFPISGFIAWSYQSIHSKHKHKEALRVAMKQTDRLEAKVSRFEERNPWFEPAFEEAVGFIPGLAAEFIADQEAAEAERRHRATYIDGTKSLALSQTLDSPVGDLPKPTRMTKFNPHEYEKYCAGWLEYLGALNVQVTKKTGDGGYDVVSLDEVAQVKLLGTQATVQPIRELFGVAQSLGKTPIFFTSTGYTKAAVLFAIDNDVLLFVADPMSDELVGVTDLAQNTRRIGLRPRDLDYEPDIEELF